MSRLRWQHEAVKTWAQWGAVGGVSLLCGTILAALQTFGVPREPSLAVSLLLALALGIWSWTAIGKRFSAHRVGSVLVLTWSYGQVPTLAATAVVFCALSVPPPARTLTPATAGIVATNPEPSESNPEPIPTLTCSERV
jgi:hypothetical protein